jgi:hypothetical protein
VIPAKHGPGRYLYVIMGVLTAVVLGAWGIKLTVGDSPFNATRASSAPAFQTATSAPTASVSNGYPDGTDPLAPLVSAGADPNADPPPNPGAGMSTGSGAVPTPAAPPSAPGAVVPPNPGNVAPSDNIAGGNGQGSAPHHW